MKHLLIFIIVTLGPGHNLFLGEVGHMIFGNRRGKMATRLTAAGKNENPV